MSVGLNTEPLMRLESSTPSRSLAWSNPVSWWWAMLTLVSGVNIAAWILMYRELHHAGSSGRIPGMEVMLLLSAAYVFGCAFRSLLPRADVQRICLFDTWLSSVAVGRSVATVAEICFAAQWTMILLQLGTMSGATTAVTAAWGDCAAAAGVRRRASRHSRRHRGRHRGLSRIPDDRRRTDVPQALAGGCRQR